MSHRKRPYDAYHMPHNMRYSIARILAAIIFYIKESPIYMALVEPLEMNIWPSAMIWPVLVL